MFDPQAIIAEAVNEPAPQEQVVTETAEQPAQAASEEAQVTEADNQETDETSEKPDSELTPEQLAKRELNRQSRLNAKLAKQRLREENRELKSRLEKLEQSLQPKSNVQELPDDYPKEDGYESAIDYIKAVAKYEARQEFKAAQPKQVDTYKVQRVQELSTQAVEFAKQVPEYAALTRENVDFLNAMPEAVEVAFLEAENAPLALYALMKEDKLELLETLPPPRIAMEIGRAEERGKAYISAVKKISSAPPPIESLNGTGRVTKHDSELSVEELLKKYNR